MEGGNDDANAIDTDGEGPSNAALIADRIEELTAILVLGGGFVALFLGLDWFWLVWVLGFVVFLPLVDVLGDLFSDLAERNAGKRADGRRKSESERADGRDPLEILKERYARGEIDEAEYERRLELLLDADTPEEARTRLDRARRTAEDPASRPGDRNRALDLE